MSAAVMAASAAAKFAGNKMKQNNAESPGASMASGAGDAMWGGVTDGLSQKVTQGIMGTPAEQAKDMADTLYSGTTPFERLSAGGGGAAGAGATGGAAQSASSIQKRKGDQVEKINKNNNDTSKEVAKTNQQTSIETAKINAKSANNVASINAGRVGILGSGFNVRALDDVAKGAAENWRKTSESRKQSKSTSVNGKDKTKWWKPKFPKEFDEQAPVHEARFK